MPAVGSEPGTSGPRRGGGCCFLGDPPHWQPPPCRRPAPLGSPSATPQLRVGGRSPAIGLKALPGALLRAVPCPDPPGSPGLGPPHHVGLCKSNSLSPGPLAPGAAPRVVPAQDLLPAHQRLSQLGQAPLPRWQPQPSSHPGWAERGAWWAPAFLVMGAPPALTGGHHRVCTTRAHLPYPDWSLRALASSSGHQAGRGTWPCSPQSPHRCDRLMDWAHLPRGLGSLAFLAPAPTSLPAPCGPGPGRAPAAPHDGLGVPLHTKGLHQPPPEQGCPCACLPPASACLAPRTPFTLAS